MRLGDDIIHNHNDLLGRYPGVDGMKTGFTCAAGFNVVASATQGGRQLIAVILGAPNVAQPHDHGRGLVRSWLCRHRPAREIARRSCADRASSPAAPPDMRAVCRKRGKAVVEFNTDIDRVMAPLVPPGPGPPRARFAH